MNKRFPQATDVYTGETFLRISVEDFRALDDSPICFGHFSVKDPICRDCNFKIKCKPVSGDTK